MTNTAWSEKLGLTFPLVSDFPRKTLEAYGILNTDPNSLLYRYAKRAYLIIDKTGSSASRRSSTTRGARLERRAASGAGQAQVTTHAHHRRYMRA